MTVKTVVQILEVYTYCVFSITEPFVFKTWFVGVSTVEGMHFLCQRHTDALNHCIVFLSLASYKLQSLCSSHFVSRCISSRQIAKEWACTYSATQHAVLGILLHVG